jgi:lysophospholipid acyltransferase (LPLAT)-like uncharacterized protein
MTVCINPLTGPLLVLFFHFMDHETGSTAAHPSSALIPFDAVSGPIWTLCRVLSPTWRCKVHGGERIHPMRDRNKGIIFCFWHSNILPIAYAFRTCGVKAVVSQSRDGERVAAVAQRWGYGVIRGSSTRGFLSAVRECVRELREKSNIAVTPDGPRGPKEIVKPGIAQIALLAGAPVVPIRAVAPRAIRLNSWDRFMIPFPFTRVDVLLKDPLYPEEFKDATDPHKQLAESIQKALLS